MVLWASSLSQVAVVTVYYTTILLLVIRDGGIELPPVISMWLGICDFKRRLLYVSRMNAKGSGLGSVPWLSAVHIMWAKLSHCVMALTCISWLRFIVSRFKIVQRDRLISLASNCGILPKNFSHPLSSVYVTKWKGSLSVTRNVPLVGPTLGASCCIWSGKYIWSRYYRFYQMTFVFLNNYWLSSCFYRASTVLRHYFITPNWCTEL